jgi:hypothetical protein
MLIILFLLILLVCMLGGMHRPPLENFVTCDFVGQFGNQLFQLGAAMSLAEKLGKRVLFPDDVQCHGWLKTKLRLADAKALRRCKQVFYGEPSFAYHAFPEDLRKHDRIRLGGYFQSYKYIDPVKKELRDLFEGDPWLVSETDKAYAKLGLLPDEPTVAVHVRRGDYLLYPRKHPVQDVAYYRTAMDIVNKGGRCRAVVFSDDIAWCKQHLGIPRAVYSEGNPAIVDMMLMMRMHHNIIANSSFSWFGAYLNDHEDKVVVAPRKWFGPDGPRQHDLIPPEWVSV